MFELVNEAESKRYRLYCSAVLQELCCILQEKGISAKFTLVGSGARNMVTRNGDGPFDLDYNLEIIKVSDEYRKDLRHLKDTVRVLLNEAIGQTRFRDSKDSTSCLTAILLFRDNSAVEFKFDVAIVKRNSKGSLCKLVHNKDAWGYGNDQYTWIEIPDSHDVSQKALRIKSEGLWLEVRERYVYLKNLYLSRPWDRGHPSFIVYVEAVNQVYDKYFQQNVSGFRKPVVLKLR